MTKPGFRGRKQKNIARKRKTRPTGDRNHVTVEEKERKKQKLSPPSITASASAATATSVLTATTTTISSPSPNTLPGCSPQCKAVAKATEQIQFLTDDDEPGSGSMGDSSQAFINGVCKDPRLKIVDKDKLVRMAMIHIYVCVLDSPPKRD